MDLGFGLDFGLGLVNYIRVITFNALIQLLKYFLKIDFARLFPISFGSGFICHKWKSFNVNIRVIRFSCLETIREIRGEESSGSGPLRSQTPALVRGELIETRDLLSGEKRGDSRGPDRGGVKGAINEVRYPLYSVI